MKNKYPQAFRAQIQRQGPNPYVDVPERVSGAFAHHARSGRISVEGTLNGTSVRTTLVPVGNRRHRLYVNGGIRAAAGVDVGDTVSFELKSTSRDQVALPEDLDAALESAEEARAAFNALSPSRRRELVRYIDDARTASTRAKRVQRTVEHTLGKPSPSSRKPRDRPMWTCPKCGNEFVNKNQYHSCRRYSLSDPFEGKPVEVKKLFDRFREIVEAQGPVKLLPYRDMVGFMVRVRFAGAVPRTRWLDVAFWLPRRVESPRFHRIETIYPDVHTHVLRITDSGQLDEQVEGWVREAYAVGR